MNNQARSNSNKSVGMCVFIIGMKKPKTKVFKQPDCETHSYPLRFMLL